MATAKVNATNVTKYDSPGGDNIIPGGFIKAVEKVWLDDYTLTANVTGTNSTITIAKLPINAKITSIVVSIETSVAQSNGTISLGFASDADAAGFGDLVGAAVITHNETLTTIMLPMQSPVDGVLDYDGNFFAKQAGFQHVIAGTRTDIALKLNNWTMTTGTVKTIVRYT